MTEPAPENALPPLSRGMRLAKQGGFHLLIWLAVFSLFAAADSWTSVTGFGLATFLSVLTAIVAGFVTTTLIHEWFHFFGAWLARATYDIPEKSGLFVFDWTYPSNNLKQFFTMSIAGSVGSVVGIALLMVTIPTDNAGRAALVAAGIASLAFAAAVEWPVLNRTRISEDPLAELSKINTEVLVRSLVFATIVGWASWEML